MPRSVVWLPWTLGSCRCHELSHFVGLNLASEPHPCLVAPVMKQKSWLMCSSIISPAVCQLFSSERPIVRRVAVSSFPKESSTYWEAYKRRMYSIVIKDSEDMVDDELHDQILSVKDEDSDGVCFCACFFQQNILSRPRSSKLIQSCLVPPNFYRDVLLSMYSLPPSYVWISLNPSTLCWRRISTLRDMLYGIFIHKIQSFFFVAMVDRGSWV